MNEQKLNSRQEILAERSKTMELKENILSEARVYLSGPMDFVASRAEEKKKGWRNRVSQFLQEYGVVVYDPWNKPNVLGLNHYGKEDEFSTNKRDNWTYEDTEKGALVRAQLCEEFWHTLHIDLRMVDTSDFIISYCPTNIYSVGTVHEIVLARSPYKPVLFVSPPISFPAHEALKEHLENSGDKTMQKMFDDFINEIPLRPNPKGIPSMWYMALVDGSYFFDGFGFKDYMKKFNWEYGELDEREKIFPPRRPLLPYLEKLNKQIPKRFDLEQNKYVENSDWLILDLPDKG